MTSGGDYTALSELPVNQKWYFVILIDSCRFQGHPGALRRRNIDLEIWDDLFFESVKILVIPKPTSESISYIGSQIDTFHRKHKNMEGNHNPIGPKS